MFTYEDFKKSLLPGNYALTKSMEITKVKSSGTLWYTKKFIVLYYYVFLSNELMTREYIGKVNESFRNYIDGLDDAVKADAERFFYPAMDSINFASDKFTTFSSFVGNFEFENQSQKDDHYHRAKKCYFMMLMDAGGQTGVKKKLKEYVQSEGFVYSRTNMDDAMRESAIDVCFEKINSSSHCIKDNSIKYLVSQEAIDEIYALDSSDEISRDEIREIITENPKGDPKYEVIENDMVAFIRNERQVLYYYGYFHSKTTGATDFEFSSLTPVGTLSIKANALEFQAIWEHQKVKMISQPPTATINDVKTDDPYRFAVSYTPYTDILGGILRRNEITLEEYKYVISRRKHLVSEEDWIVLENDIISKMPEIERIIKDFHRTRDQEDEDGRKELLKYLLGIRDDLSKDKKTNSLGMCSVKENRATCTSEDKLRMLYDIYTKLNDYKIRRYGDLFDRCEADLRRRYAAKSDRQSKLIDAQVKIDWDLYNIKFDKVIMMTVMFAASAIACNVFDWINAADTDLEPVYDCLFSNYEIILKSFGIKSLKKVKGEYRKLLYALKNDDFDPYFIEEEHEPEVLAAYRSESTADLMEKIISASNFGDRSEEKKRNMYLIKLIKSYYMSVYLKNNTLRCECCGNEAFITVKDEPYLEFHHLIPFSEAEGPDHYLNLFALCPNCHRMLHHIKRNCKAPLFNNISKNNYFEIEIIDRLKKLKKAHILESYHLEYLLAQEAITEKQYNEVVA